MNLIFGFLPSHCFEEMNSCNKSTLFSSFEFVYLFTFQLWYKNMGDAELLSACFTAPWTLYKEFAIAEKGLSASPRQILLYWKHFVKRVHSKDEGNSRNAKARTSWKPL